MDLFFFVAPIDRGLMLATIEQRLAVLLGLRDEVDGPKSSCRSGLNWKHPFQESSLFSLAETHAS